MLNSFFEDNTEEGVAPLTGLTNRMQAGRSRKKCSGATT